MGRTSGSWTKGDPRAKANGPKAFHAKLVNRGRRLGKARWASMTQEEKDWVWGKRDYAIAQRNKRRKRLDESLSKHTAFKVPPTASSEDMDDIENFFYGEVF